MISGCIRLQRYKTFEAIHNWAITLQILIVAVSDCKDTKLLKQFTTGIGTDHKTVTLYQIAKIQNF